MKNLLQVGIVLLGAATAVWGAPTPGIKGDVS